MAEIEVCGYRATGMMLVKDDEKLYTIKDKVCASEFLKIPNVKTTLEDDFRSMIGHCRFPTKGDVNFPENNHPFVLGNTAIVHQGVLSNDEEIKKKYQFKPEGQTDSWIIVHLIEYWRNKGKSVVDAIAQAHEELKGSWAVALVDLLETDKIYLFCHYKSFKVNYYPEEEIFFFSTEDKKLDKYNLEIKEHFQYFQELITLRTSEVMVKTEDLLVLGGKEDVSMWRLPEPENEWLGHKSNHRFGDGWKGKEKEDEEFWENYFNKKENGGEGRHLLENKK